MPEFWKPSWEAPLKAGGATKAACTDGSTFVLIAAVVSALRACRAAEAGVWLVDFAIAAGAARPAVSPRALFGASVPMLWGASMMLCREAPIAAAFAVLHAASAFAAEPGPADASGLAEEEAADLSALPFVAVAAISEDKALPAAATDATSLAAEARLPLASPGLIA